MKRTILLTVAALAAFGVCAHSLAAVTGEGQASVQIDQAASINIVTPLVLPTVSTTAVVNTAVVNTSQVNTASSSATSGSATTSSAPSNATLTISSQSGDAVSVAVPETFQVTRTGGAETLTVKTNTNSQYNVANNGVMVGGSADTMSVNVGGTLSLASADQLVPGPYEGLLVVVVQYN
ncbi:MAG: DUF4402 domain-containing protein [Phenylobacterium sp.]|nr:MAG: DUF4402 domain-containing protein [Phenylobacterium sp.]